MKQSQTKKVYIYPIKDTDGTPLDLINVLTNVLSTGVSNAGGERKAAGGGAQKLVLDRVDTFIARHDRGEYIKVGSTPVILGWTTTGWYVMIWYTYRSDTISNTSGRELTLRINGVEYQITSCGSSPPIFAGFTNYEDRET